MSCSIYPYSPRLRLVRRRSTRVWALLWHLLQFPRQGGLDSRRSDLTFRKTMALEHCVCDCDIRVDKVWLTLIASPADAVANVANVSMRKPNRPASLVRKQGL